MDAIVFDRLKYVTIARRQTQECSEILRNCQTENPRNWSFRMRFEYCN